MKLNSTETYEPINVVLTKNLTPIAYNNKIKELVEQGCYPTKEEAEKAHPHFIIECEIYYQKNIGLFAVESEAVEYCDIYSPYTGELCEQYKEDEIQQKYAFNIEWETDGEEVDLPTKVILPYTIDEEDVTDYLSDNYGFLVKSYELS